MHKTIDPTVLYFGTPVALISTLNEDGSAKVAPPRVREYPVQVEGVARGDEAFGGNVSAYAFEVHIEKLHPSRLVKSNFMKAVAGAERRAS